MEGIEFETERSLQRPIEVKRELPKMTKLVMKFGVSDPTKANSVLLIFAIITFIISIFLFINSGNSEGKSKSASTNEDQILIQMNNARQ